MIVETAIDLQGANHINQNNDKTLKPLVNVSSVLHVFVSLDGKNG